MFGSAIRKSLNFRCVIIQVLKRVSRKQKKFANWRESPWRRKRLFMIVVFLVHDVSIIATRPRIIIIRRSIAIVSCPENKLWVIRYMIASFSSPPLVHINLKYILTLKPMKRKPINYSEQTPGGQQHHRRFLPLCSFCGLERAMSKEEVSPATSKIVCSSYTN